MSTDEKQNKENEQPAPKPPVEPERTVAPEKKLARGDGYPVFYMEHPDGRTALLEGPGSKSVRGVKEAEGFKIVEEREPTPYRDFGSLETAQPLYIDPAVGEGKRREESGEQPKFADPNGGEPN